MIFSFTAYPVSVSLGMLGQIETRYRYPVELGVRGSGLRTFCKAFVDTGSDDIIIPLDEAPPGLDMTGAPEITHTVANGGKMRVQFAEVELTLAASLTHFVRWRAVVGFADVPRAVLGFRGGLEFFTFISDTTNLRFTLLPNQRMPAADVRVPATQAAMTL